MADADLFVGKMLVLTHVILHVAFSVVKWRAHLIVLETVRHVRIIAVIRFAMLDVHEVVTKKIVVVGVVEKERALVSHQ